MPLDETRLESYMSKMVGDLGAAATGALIVLGDRLGLYRALSGGGAASSTELAQRTGTRERYVREWLSAQAASGYVEYNPSTRQFSMSPEQCAVFADEDSPHLMTGGYHSVASVFADEPRMAEAFRTGEGLAWGERHHSLFCGTARFFKPNYQANLLSQWLPALDGVVEKLERGAKVADVGCGHGISTRLMAEAFPRSEFVGFDIHEPSVEQGRKDARAAGLPNLSFDVATAKSYPGRDYDLVTFFDCLHDMGDPVGAARHVHQALNSKGTWMIVEPFAHDDLAQNLNPVARVFYAFSTMVCTPSSLSQEVGLALGAQAGEGRLREAVTAGGFTRFRRATETPFNLILEARP